MVAHPAPPQTRTCAMHASGSSSRAAAAPGAVHWPAVVRVRELKVSPLSPASGCSARRRLPSRGSLGPQFPTFPSTMRRYDCHPAPLEVLRLSLASPIPCLLPSFVVSQMGSSPGGSPRRRQGVWSPGPPFRVCGQGDRWLSHVPTFPLWRHAPLSDPGGVLRTRHNAPRTAAFRRLHTVGFPLRKPCEFSSGPQLYTFRGSITRPVSSLPPASYGPLRGGTRVRY